MSQEEAPIIYPLSQTNFPQPVTRQHPSNGSFGTVFIVLAVIVVISAIACFLGRLCNKRSAKAEKRGGHHDKPSKQKHQGGAGGNVFRGPPKLEREPKHMGHGMKDGGDIEFGFDRPMRMPPPSAKVAASGGGGGEGGGGMHPMGMGRNPSQKGREVRFADQHRAGGGGGGGDGGGGDGQQY